MWLGLQEVATPLCLSGGCPPPSQHQDPGRPGPRPMAKLPRRPRGQDQDPKPLGQRQDCQEPKVRAARTCQELPGIWPSSRIVRRYPAPCRTSSLILHLTAAHTHSPTSNIPIQSSYPKHQPASARNNQRSRHPGFRIQAARIP